MTGALLTVQDVHAGYLPGVDILRGLSLAARPNEITLVIGPNGAGKSTLLRTVFAFLAPNQGGITFRGESTAGMRASDLKAAGISYVTQDINSREIDMSRYIVSARRSDFNWQQARSVTVAQPDSPSTGQVIHAKVPLLDSGFAYEFRVQAVRLSGYVSDYSNAITQTMGYPTEAPPVPSAPILSTKLSTVKAEWNGKDNTNANMPASFREVQVEVSINNSTWFHVGDIFSGGAGLIMSGEGGAPTWNVGGSV